MPSELPHDASEAKLETFAEFCLNSAINQIENLGQNAEIVNTNLAETAMPEPDHTPHTETLLGPKESTNDGDQRVSLSLAQELNTIKQNLDVLAHDFQTKLKYDAAKQLIIDKLHFELQEYRNNMVQKLVQPFILDAIQIIDDHHKICAFQKTKATDQLDPEKLLAMLEHVPESIEDMLYRQGVDTFETQEQVFDPKRQKALERVDTSDANLDKTIAKRLRKGYEWDGKVIRPELVSVYIFKKQLP